MSVSSSSFAHLFMFAMSVSLLLSVLYPPHEGNHMVPGIFLSDLKYFLNENIEAQNFVVMFKTEQLV